MKLFPLDEVESLTTSDYNMLIENNRKPYKQWRMNLANVLAEATGVSNNFATANLTLTAARTHDVDGNNFTMTNGAAVWLQYNQATSSLLLAGSSNDRIDIDGANNQIDLIIDGIVRARMTSSFLSLTNALRLSGSSSGYIAQEASATTTDYTLTWPAAQGTGVLSNNGAGALSWVTGPLTIVTGSGTITGVEGNHYAVDTSSGVALISPPSTPVAGERFGVSDDGANFGTNSCTIRFNTAGTRYNGQAADLVLSTDHDCVVFEYVNLTIGWLLIGGSL